MRQVDLAVQSRAKNSKNGNRRARRSGQLPAVVYGGGAAPQPVLVDGVQFGKLMPNLKGTTIFNLKVDGAAAQPSIIRELQRDPVHDLKLVHVDFYRISLDKPIQVEVPIHHTGVPAGVKVGGVLETVLRRVIVRCLPLEVPDAINVDVSALEIGDSIHISDVTPPDRVTFVTPPEAPVYIVAAPSGAMVEEASTETAAPAVAGAEGVVPAEGAAAPAEGAPAAAAAPAAGAKGAAPAAAAKGAPAAKAPAAKGPGKGK